MSTRAFKSFATLPQEALPSCAANPLPVAVDGVTRLRMVLPVAPSAIRFGDVAPHANRFEIDHHLIAVIALVCDHFVDLAVGYDRLDLFGGADEPVDSSVSKRSSFRGVLRTYSQ